MTLLDESGRLHHLDPATIEVVEAGGGDIEQLEDDEPLIGDPGWGRITDSDAAIAAGHVALKSDDGMSWDALLERMRGVLKPLVDAGWEVVQGETDESEEDCVVCLLRRSADHLSVDHYLDGWSLLWETDSDFLSSEEGSALQLGPDNSVVALRSTFEERGWI